MDLLYVIAGLGLCWGTVRILRGGWRGERGFQMAGFDVNSAGMGVVAILAAMYFFGVIYGIALMIAVVIHEFGHVAAFRVCGHSDARFRLIPLLGGVAISNSLPASAEKSFFITLMGPAINLGPMVLCFALSNILWDGESSASHAAARYLGVQGLVLATLNLFNLLPLWPLDGGRMTQKLFYTFAPDLTRSVSIAMAGFAVLLCVLTESFVLLAFVIMNLPAAFQAEALLRAQRAMSTRRALLAMSAYLTTTAAFGWGAWPLVQDWL